MRQLMLHFVAKNATLLFSTAKQTLQITETTQKHPSSYLFVFIPKKTLTHPFFKTPLLCANVNEFKGFQKNFAQMNGSFGSNATSIQFERTVHSD